MNPHPLFCLNVDCPSRGVQNGGNIRVHHSLEERFRYTTCGQTFATQGNLLRAWGRLVSFGSGDAPEGALAATDAAPVRVKKVKDGYRITRWLLVADYSHNPQTVSQERVEEWVGRDGSYTRKVLQKEPLTDAWTWPWRE